MDLTPEQVLALAPDASSVAAAKKLATPRTWRSLGRDARALWGECQGTATYRVGVDVDDLAPSCSCPSRKVPCKHALALLLLAASGAVPEATPPPWALDWLETRARTASRREISPLQGKGAGALGADPEAQAKRAEARRAKVAAGVDALDLWMNDLVRQGLATVETKPFAYWETQAARLVDAQAPALAGRIRRIGGQVGAAVDWPERVLDELGRTALLTHALRRIDALPPPLRADVRTLIGWTLNEADVDRDGERIADRWLVVAVTIDDGERVQTRRTWLRGARSERMALVLDFAAGGAPFGEAFALGTSFEAEAVFWPSAAPMRARIADRRATRVWGASLPGGGVEAVLDAFARTLAAHPWAERVGVTLGDVAAVPVGDDVFVRDARGDALPLSVGDHARLLAVSGGHPIGVAGEWNGRTLRPLTAVVQNAFISLRGE